MIPSFICEIGSNHNKSLDRCFAQIDVAKKIGADAVKFQLFKADRLYAPEFPDKIAIMKGWELPPDFIPGISNYCKQVGIEFGCTPFDLEAVDILAPHVDFLKIGSYELLRKDLIQSCAKTYLPLMISTGMATWEEVEQAITETTTTIFHCVSGYPARPSECNLSVIQSMSYLFWGKVGWSDHTREPGVIFEAVAQGAKVIECHFDIDGCGWETQHGHCWLPDELKSVIDTVKIMESAIGNGT